MAELADRLGLDLGDKSDGEFVNLSSWTVTLTRGYMGWEWNAVHANGTELGGPGFYIDKQHAERDAVKAMERRERNDDQEELNGYELRERVASRKP